MELRKEDLELLERMVDAYSMQSVVEALSRICSDKSEHIAVNWQDTASAMGWMAQARHLDQLVAKWERLEGK
jgi:methionine synthase I (cobalamin-dependent)